MAGRGGPGALIPRLRLQLTQFNFPLVQPPYDQELDEWLASLPSPLDPVEETRLEFGVSVTANADRLTWRAAGTPDEFIPRLGDYFHERGVSGQEMERISQAGAAIQPDTLGSWVEAGEQGFDAGWYFPVNVPLTQALEVAGSQAGEALGAWAEESGVHTCTRLGRSVGTGHPFTELVLPLPAGDVEEQVYTGLRAFTALGIPPLPDEALGPLLFQAGERVALSVWLSATGVAKAGLLAAHPPTLLMLDLVQVAGVNDFEPLAALEGLLGVEGPEWIECQQRATGFGVELHYRPAADLEG
jgi:hypothetical protein